MSAERVPIGDFPEFRHSGLRIKLINEEGYRKKKTQLPHIYDS